MGLTGRQAEQCDEQLQPLVMVTAMKAMTARGRHYVGATHRAALRARFDR